MKKKVAKKSRKLKYSETHDVKLKSPAQMAKICKNRGLDFSELFGAHVAKISSGTTVAAADDPREAVPGLAQIAALIDLA